MSPESSEQPTLTPNAYEWEFCADWWQKAKLLWSLGGGVHDRHLHLLYCGFARKDWPHHPQPIKDAFVLTEAYADAIDISEAAADYIKGLGRQASRHYPSSSVQRMCSLCCTRPIGGLGFEAACIASEHDVDGDWGGLILHDLVPNPYQSLPVAQDEWLTDNNAAVYLLAQEIYFGYRFELMPALADSLEQAGCREISILNHCRSSLKHFRGCWVIDLLLKPNEDMLGRALRLGSIAGDRIVEYYKTRDRNPLTLYSG